MTPIRVFIDSLFYLCGLVPVDDLLELKRSVKVNRRDYIVTRCPFLFYQFETDLLSGIFNMRFLQQYEMGTQIGFYVLNFEILHLRTATYELIERGE